MSAAGTADGTGSGATLFIARHGQSEWNNTGRITGRLDPGLSPRGLRQAEGLARWLSGVPLHAIYVSGLQRTAATAEPSARVHGLPLRRLDALDEIGLGELQGRYRDERDPAAQALWARWQADPWTFQVPGGERFDGFAARVEAALAGILQRHAGERLLIVGHRATNRVLLGRLLGWPRERWFDLRPRNKHCYRIRPGAAPGDAPAIATLTLDGGKAGRWVDEFVQ